MSFHLWKGWAGLASIHESDHLSIAVFFVRSQPHPFTMSEHAEFEPLEEEVVDTSEVFQKGEVLHLNLRRHIFHTVLDGSKKTEYRDKKAYWLKRLGGDKAAQYCIVRFRNGYRKDAPSLDQGHQLRK